MAGLDWENREDIFEEQKNEELTQQEIQRKIAVEKTQEFLAGLSLIAKKEILTELLKRTSAEIEAEKETEQKIKHAALRPEWLSHTPQDTQDYRKRLEDKARQWDNEAIQEVEFFQWKFAYNADGTVNLIQLNETFCADLTGNWWTRNSKNAKELAETKWYHLLMDYNDSDSEIEKRKTDWYKLEQYFGEYAKTWAITYILGCITDRYWTGTEYKNKDWSRRESYARMRGLRIQYINSYWDYILIGRRVCGFKKMNTAT